MTVEGPPPSRVLEQAAELLKERDRFREATEKKRAEVDKLGKILSGSGVSVIGAVIAAIGLVKLFDIFPLKSNFWVVFFMALGFILMLVAAGVGARVLFRSARRTVFTSDVSQIIELSRGERKFVRVIYASALVATDAATMRAFEARGERLQRVSDRIPEVEQSLRDEAAFIEASRAFTYSRAMFELIGRRFNRAIILTGICTVGFLIGLGTLVVSIDKVEADRAEATKKEEKAEKAAEAKLAAAAPAPAETLAEGEQRVKVEKGELVVDRLCAANANAGVYDIVDKPEFCLPTNEMLSWLKKNLPLIRPFFGSG